MGKKDNSCPCGYNRRHAFDSDLVCPDAGTQEAPFTAGNNSQRVYADTVYQNPGRRQL
jgi:hypothetical protein